MNIKTSLNKIGFWGRKHSPEILIVSGIISAAASVGMAIYATTKLESKLKPANEKIKAIKAGYNSENTSVEKTQYRRDLTKAYASAVVKVGALYLPCTLLFASSVACILGSHKIMRGRNLALSAAFATLERSYNAYRERVKEKIGEEAEEKIYKNIYKDEVEVIDPKTGKVTTKKKEIPHVDVDNDWNVLYDCGCTCWEHDALMNFDFLMLQQDYFNEKLKRQGYLFLHDIYKDLGFTTAMLGEKKARASRILGWIYDPSNPNRNCYISFGLTQPGTRVPLPKIAEQIQHNEPTFWLSLNPDGDILSGEYNKETYMKYAIEKGIS